MNPISFTASYKTSAVIQTRRGDSFNPVQAYIVELDKNNAEDLNSLHKVSRLWNKENSNLIYYMLADFIQDLDLKPDVNENHCLILTTQKDNFENIDPQKVLGAMLFSEENMENELNWLQVQPKHNSKFKPVSRRYKGVGTALVSYLKAKFTDKPIYVYSSNTAIDFYKKLGFNTYDDKYPCSMYYEA